MAESLRARLATVPRGEWLALGLIMTVAALLRMGWPGVTEFKLDEARVVSLALGLVEFRSLPLTATAMSVGLPNSPLTIYLYALPLFVWKSPLAPLLFGAALNTAAVALLYALARRYWGARAALLAALLYATAPWAVIYSRKIWASNLLPLFLVGYVFSGLLAFAEARRRWVIVHLVLLSVIVQIHISSVALAPVTAGLLWLQRRRLNWRWVGYGLAGALLLEAPFLLYLLRSAEELGGGAAHVAGRTIEVSADVVALAAMVVEGTYTHSLAGPSAYRAFLASVPNFNPLFWIGGLLALVGAVRLGQAWWSRWRRDELDASSRAGGIVLLWLLMPAAFFLVHFSPVYPHYLTLYFSIAFVLSGVGLDWLLRRSGAWWQRMLVLAVPLAIAGAQVLQLAALLKFVRTHSTPEAFGVPLERLLQVAGAAKGLKGQDILVVSDGTDAWNDGTPAAFDILLHGRPHRFVDGRTTAVFPSGQAAVILWPAPDGSGRPSQALYQAWAGGQWAAEVPLRLGEGQALVAASAGQSLPVPRPREASALLSDGAEVLGSGDDVGLWQLWWRAPGPRPGEDVHLFAHLLDADGVPLAQADLPTYPAADWRAGDLVASYFALPEGGASVRAGMYAYPSLAPVAVLDGTGQPDGEYLLFPRTLAGAP